MTVSFAYALVDAIGHVDRLLEFADLDAIPEGLSVVELLEPQTCWPASPFEGATLTVDGGALSWADLRNMEAARMDRWATIKAARDAAEFGGFDWDGSTFDSDEISQARIQGAVILAMQAVAAETVLQIDWTLADNTVRTLSATELTSLGLALGTHVQTQHTIARGLREQIDAATTNEELEGIAWP